MALLNLKSLDQNLFLTGDDSAARTITIGQQVTNSDVLVVDTATLAISAAGAITAAGASTFSSTLGVTGVLTCTAQAIFSNGASFTTVPTSPTAGTTSEGWGSGALANITASANRVTAVGNGAGAACTTGDDSIYIGTNAGSAITTGANIIAIGSNTLTAAGVATFSGQVAIGTDAMRYSEGQNSLAIGLSALEGSQSTAHTGQFTTAIGANSCKSLEGNTWNNTAIGANTLTAATTGFGNTCIGKDAGKAVTTGSSNLFIGLATGDTTTTGDANILIGSGLDCTAATTTGELRIHYAGGSNTPIISADMVSGIAGCNILPANIDATWHIVTDATDAVDTLRLEQLDVSENFIAFESTSAASTVNPITTFTTGNSVQGHVRVDVNGTARWIRFYDAPTS